MAEGGYDPTDPTNETTPFIPGKGDDDDEDTGTVNPGMNWADVDLGQYSRRSRQNTTLLNQALLPPQPVVSQYL